LTSTAGGEVVFDVSGDGEAAEEADLDPLADLLAPGAALGDDSSDVGPENLLLRVQGVGYVPAACLVAFTFTTLPRMCEALAP
jgi:hypothetical protein